MDECLIIKENMLSELDELRRLFLSEELNSLNWLDMIEAYNGQMIRRLTSKDKME